MKNLYEKIETYQKTNDEDLLELIIEEHMQLVYHIAHKYKFLLPLYDDVDIKQELLMELHNAIKRYDLKSSAKFSSYAYLLMKNKALNMSRNEKALKRNSGKFIYLESYISNSGIKFDEVLHEENDLEYNLIQEEKASELKKYLLETLKPSEVELYNMYIYGKSVKEISKFYNIPEKACRNKLTYIKRKLRNNSKNYNS